MKYLLLFIALFAAIAPSYANSESSVLAMEDGCKRGAQDGAQIAVLTEQAFSTMILATLPDSPRRKLAIKTLTDLGRKKEDEYIDLKEKEKDSMIGLIDKRNDDFYIKQTLKTNIEILFMAMQRAYKIGIQKGMENAVNEISSSETRYRREIENECKKIFSSR
jgi:hypothetical protein